MLQARSMSMMSSLVSEESDCISEAVKPSTPNALWMSFSDSCFSQVAAWASFRYHPECPASVEVLAKPEKHKLGSRIEITYAKDLYASLMCVLLIDAQDIDPHRTSETRRPETAKYTMQVSGHSYLLAFKCYQDLTEGVASTVGQRIAWRSCSLSDCE